jgi:hypothetical protein
MEVNIAKGFGNTHKNCTSIGGFAPSNQRDEILKKWQTPDNVNRRS